jgi:hypothetical protein
MPPWLLNRGPRLMDRLGGGKFVTTSGEAWYVYNCKALVVKAREVGRCMNALSIILGAREYKIYLATRTGSNKPN